MTDQQTLAAEDITSLDDLYTHADHLGVTPGWVNREQPIFWAAPRPASVPAHWSYGPVREALDAAGGLIDVSLAERRNLVMRNPADPGGFGTCRTMACAYQMIMPGEVAPTHRHAPHALRVMLDARGTYSVVDGERVPMETGDVVVTPGDVWHGHGHDGTDVAYWFDALDIPLVHLLEPMRYEDHPDGIQEVTATSEESPYRHRASDVQRMLDEARGGGDTPHVRVDLPLAGVPSMQVVAERIEAGATTAPSRSTANRVCVVVEGSGTTQVGDQSFGWSRGDTIVAPMWEQFSHTADEASTLYEISDEPTMRLLGHYRQEG